jgi:hypothetical protein
MVELGAGARKNETARDGAALFESSVKVVAGERNHRQFSICVSV